MRLMPFSIRTIVQAINALAKHGYIGIVRRMEKENPIVVRAQITSSERVH